MKASAGQIGGLAAVLIAASLVLPGCASRQWQGFGPGDPEYVWPAAPETPRVAYAASIRGHEDLFRIGNGLKRLVGWIAGPPDSAMVRPYAVAVHPAGGLLVTDPGRRTVHFYDWTHRRYVTLGRELPEGLPSPVGVGVLPSGEIVVSDSRLGRVERFTAEGKHAGAFAGAEHFGRPAGIAVHEATGTVFVADVTNHRVVVLDAQGAVVRTIGDRGAEPGQFNFPTHVALDAQGNLVVTDSMNFRVQTLTREGAALGSIGRLGDGPGEFSKPKGVAVDAAGNIIAVESLYGALEFFNEGGELLLSLGTPGQGPGEFWLPAGLAIDRAEGLVFVADSYNSRVQVFRLLTAENSAEEGRP